MKRFKPVFLLGISLLVGLLIGVLMGRYKFPNIPTYIAQTNDGVAVKVVQEEYALVPGVELLELHAYKEELMVDVPIPAIRLQIKFRTPQEVTEKMKVEFYFHGSLKEQLGIDRSALTNRETLEEHFGWATYTYGFFYGGNTISPDVIEKVAEDPYLYISARVFYAK